MSGKSVRIVTPRIVVTECNISRGISFSYQFSKSVISIRVSNRNFWSADLVHRVRYTLSRLYPQNDDRMLRGGGRAVDGVASKSFDQTRICGN